MLEFQNFVKIVEKLSEEEYKNLLNIKKSSYDETPNFVRLIKFARTHGGGTAEEAQAIIYGCQKPIAFSQLVYRSKEKLLDSFILSDSIFKSLYYDERAKEVLSIRKQLIQFDILCLRGLNAIGGKLINKIIRKAKLYEYYDLLVFALYKKIRIASPTSTLDEYQNQVMEIKKYEDCRLTFHKLEMYYKGLNIYLNEQEHIDAYNLRVKKYYLESEEDYIRTKSFTVLYYSLLFKAQHFEQLDQLVKVNSIYRQLVDLVSNNKYLNSNHGLSFAYYNVCRLNICLLNFDEARYAIKRAYQLTKYYDPTNFTIYNYRFLIGFFDVHVKELESNIEVLLAYLYSGVIVNYLASLVRYYNSCMRFLNKDYISSFLLLNDVKELEKDKQSWNIAIRVLAIMNQIELENYEIADNLIENLRKHHERVRKTLSVSKRDEKIIQILTTLSRHSYRFRRTYKAKIEAFELLDSLDRDYRWKILSPEMIVFHEWFISKTRDEKYDHFKVMPAMKKKYSKLHKAFVSLEDNA